MKRIFVFAALSIFIMISCQTTQPFAYKIIRQNYFDSNHFELSRIDTNKVNLKLYQNIFDKIKLDSSTKCLLLNIYSVVSNEYGLYDYKNGKYFYSSIEDKGLYDFKVTSSKSSKDMYNIMKEYIEAKQSSLSLIDKKNNLLDGAHFILSFINVNQKKEILVKSYYW